MNDDDDLHWEHAEAMDRACDDMAELREQVSVLKAENARLGKLLSDIMEYSGNDIAWELLPRIKAELGL